MSNLRPAPAAHPIHPLIAGRWSPRAFSERPVDPATLARLFEAARWAPSSYNEQPWRYVIGTTRDLPSLEALGSLLVEANAWARRAPVLALSIAKLDFERNGKPNRHAWHDVGAASCCLFLQAFHEGLYAHEMAGFDRARAVEQLGLDSRHEPVAMIAIGWPGSPEELSDPLRAREQAPRERAALASFVFEGAWNRPARF